MKKTAPSLAPSLALALAPSLALALALSSAAPAFAQEPPQIALPAPEAARLGHCGFESELDLLAYMRAYRAHLTDALRLFGRNGAFTGSDPAAASFTSLYVFADATAYEDWRKAPDPAALRATAAQAPAPFSICQALALAQEKGAPVIALTGPGSAAKAAIFTPPRP